MALFQVYFFSFKKHSNRFLLIVLTLCSYRLYVDVYVLLCTLSQRSLPYHVTGVESNDELFGGTLDYNLESRNLIRDCVCEINRQLTALSGVVQTQCCILFLSHFIEHTQVTRTLCSVLTGIMDLIPVSVAKIEKSQQVSLQRILKKMKVEVDCLCTQERERDDSVSNEENAYVQQLLDCISVRSSC